MLVHEGMHVIGLDREAGALDVLAAELGCRFRPVACDVANVASVAQASRVVASMQPDGLDAIVHFAGLHSAGALMDLVEGEFARVLDVNVSGVWRVQRAFFSLLQLRRGRTLLISSEVARARFCHAFSGAYALSKVCLDHFAVALRQELQLLQPPMDVVVLHLGMFATPMLGRATTCFGAAAERQPASPFAPALLACDALVRWYCHPGTADHTARFSPERVAQKVLEVLEVRRPRNLYTLNVSWAMRLVALIPSAVLDVAIVSGLRAQLYGGGLAAREALTALLTAVAYLF
ncbi:hypothetical protein KFE25_003415 [Diacronema lutheri]|uniref:Uncharacterized protein n=1 Tax=Diacronema lutheri TaxID=2081491 RepID=A0A8J5XHW4_DIALT|nr:hypothetical protein KFE25_003415 [Diacronema lutheri]